MGVNDARARGALAWLTWAVLCGLVLVFAGERIVPAVTPFRVALSGAGTLLLVVATVARALAWRRASGDARAVERIFLLAYGGCVLAVVLFLLAGGLGVRLGIGAPGGRLEAAAVVLGFVLLSTSLFPLFAAQWAIGPDYAPNEATVSVDRLRIAQVATAALTVGLALPFLMLSGYVATERDKTVDLSYFKTSSPGTATQRTVESLAEPLRVLLFFPPTSDVSDQLITYFRTLGEGRQVEVEQVDRLVSPNLAEQYGVVTDGTVVLTSGGRTERIVLPVDLRRARLLLRTLDEDVQQSVIRLAREERNVYFTIGHGEINDQQSASGIDTMSASTGTYAVESMLGFLNYGVRNLGLRAGATDVPSDAAMVFVLGPKRPFLDAELRALERYIARGGSVLFALEPDSEFELGPLSEQLGVDFSHVQLADDQNFAPMAQNLSDHRVLVTDNLYAHASTANAGQGVAGDAVVVVGAGSLIPRDDGAAGVFVTARAKNTAFADSTRDYEARPTDERLQYPLAVAVESPAIRLADSQARAVLFADADMFTDFILTRVALNQLMLADAVRWLGHEEATSGETSSEADIPIVHTRRENVVWFYSTILGAPGLVLALGLLSVRRRRARQTELAA